MRNEARSAVGSEAPTVDGAPKARGRLKFIQDVSLPGMIHAAMVFAGAPHARIKSVSLKKALSLEGVVAAATCDDVPGENRVGLVIDDQPLFASGVTRYEADCVAIIGAENEADARRGVSAVEVELEDLPAVLTVEEARQGGGPSVHRNGNLAVQRHVVKGEVAEGEAQSEFIVEKTFRMPVQEHGYLEPLGAVAVPGADGSIEIMASAQCPFYIRDAVARCMGLPMAKVRVIQLPMGGAFGGKEDVPSEICARLAVLAVKTGRPVKMVLSREEDLVYTSKRHPMRLDYRMGCTRDGLLTFADIELFADVGAYATLSPIVLFRSTIHAAGPYEIANVRVATRGFYTNTTPKGAMRGFGTPQVVFACEAVIDELAAEVGLDPLEFRIKNALKPGGTTATGQVLDESVGFVETLEKVKQLIGDDRQPFRPHKTGRDTVRSRGLAAMYYGVSLGAAGRTLDRGGARVEVLKDGSVSIFIGCTDMGQGALTVLGQIAADSLGISPSDVRVNRVDTSVVPDSGPTVASRTTIVSGNAIVDACDKIKARMVEVGSSFFGRRATYDQARGGVVESGSRRRLGFAEVVSECFAGRVDLTATGWYVVPDCRVDEATGQGKAYHVYSFAADVADVEVDTRTGRVDVKSFLAVHDSGKIINPMTAVSQVEGGVAQGIGLALYEEFTVREGRVCSRDLSTYLMPTSLDVCDDLRVEFIECHSADGPFGAKGLGEPAIIPVAAAVANAVSNATGVRVEELPVRRGRIVESA